MDKYFVITHAEGKSAYFRFVWGDVEKYNAEIINYPVEFNSSFLRIVYRIHNSNDINKIISLPFKNIWRKYYALKLEMLNPEDRNFLIFDSTIKYSHKYLKYLKENYNCVIVNILQDTLKVYKCGKNKKSLDRYLKEKCVDRLFSFDFDDCEKYGLEYYMLYCYEGCKDKSNTVGSVLYVGSCKSKSRLDIFHSIYNKLKTKCKLDFNMVGVNDSDQLYKNEIKYNVRLPYNEVVSKIKENDCLLDIVNEGQSGISLRCCEAICFNKKLITNNPNIKKSQFYNPEYIYVYDSIDDISEEWINTPVDVDYNYKGEFHPANLFKKLSENY